LRYNAAWDTVPYMRSVLRITTAVWGIAFLLEVAIRVVLVFHVSTRQALAMGPIIFYAMMLSLIAWTVFYVRRTKPRIEATLDRARNALAPAARGKFVAAIAPRARDTRAAALPYRAPRPPSLNNQLPIGAVCELLPDRAAPRTPVMAAWGVTSRLRNRSAIRSGGRSHRAPAMP
jgi:hypothetical protein